MEASILQRLFQAEGIVWAKARGRKELGIFENRTRKSSGLNMISDIEEKQLSLKRAQFQESLTAGHPSTVAEVVHCTEAHSCQNVWPVWLLSTR